MEMAKGQQYLESRSVNTIGLVNSSNTQPEVQGPKARSPLKKDTRSAGLPFGDLKLSQIENIVHIHLLRGEEAKMAMKKYGLDNSAEGRTSRKKQHNAAGKGGRESQTDRKGCETSRLGPVGPRPEPRRPLPCHLPIDPYISSPDERSGSIPRFSCLELRPPSRNNEFGPRFAQAGLGHLSHQRSTRRSNSKLKGLSPERQTPEPGQSQLFGGEISSQREARNEQEELRRLGAGTAATHVIVESRYNPQEPLEHCPPAKLLPNLKRAQDHSDRRTAARCAGIGLLSLRRIGVKGTQIQPQSLPKIPAYLQCNLGFTSAPRIWSRTSSLKAARFPARKIHDISSHRRKASSPPPPEVGLRPRRSSDSLHPGRRPADPGGLIGH